MWIRTLLFLLVLATPIAAQGADAVLRASGTTISGVVRDSVARVPLAGALVQLAASGGAPDFIRSTETDSLGHFSFSAVQGGRYILGFHHPVLDSLGLEPPVKEVTVDGASVVRLNLSTPSPERINAAICDTTSATASSRGAAPRVSASSSGAVLLGIVRDARTGQPSAGAAVSGEWAEYQLTRGGIGRRLVRRVATAGRNGWFALCDVPRGGAITLLAEQGTDSTDRIELQVPEGEHLLRRDLYLGGAQEIAATRAELDSATTVITGATTTLPSRRGDGRLRGTVTAAETGQPIAGARVRIPRSAETQTDDRGEWALADVPRGTRLLEVRALGFYPLDRAVDVAGGELPVRLAMSTFKAVMDTVRIVASRVRDRQLSGFAERRRVGMGRFLDAEEIMRRQPIATSDIFRSVGGLRIEGARGALGTRVSMGGAFGDCAPSLYINGHRMPGAERDPDTGAVILTTDDIDIWVKPEEIAGIEVYTGTAVPPQFQEGLGGCGSIVIWTK